MKKYMLIHLHDEGQTQFFFSSKRKPNLRDRRHEAVLVEALRINFEPDKEEGFILVELENTEFPFVDL